jgi:hypothetical protein
MQFVRSGPVDAALSAVVPAKIIRCDQCQNPLGDKRVLTRDAAGATRRFCPDNVCFANWQRDFRIVFRRV